MVRFKATSVVRPVSTLTAQAVANAAAGANGKVADDARVVASQLVQLRQLKFVVKQMQLSHHP
jgi:hypothetical protein